MKKLTLLACFFCLAAPAWPRGGGGCFEEGSPVLTPSGPVSIQRLRPGDKVLAGVDGKPSLASVQALYRVVPGQYFEITAAGRTVRVTGAHPFRTGPGTYKEASRLKAGDTLSLLENGALRAVKVSSVKKTGAGNPAYDLLVFPGGQYYAGGFLVHNKGCFLPDTQILKADGTGTAISGVKKGDGLLSFTNEGKAVKARVLDIITVEADEYFELKTGRITVRATAEHPFYIGGGVFKTLEALKPGDTVYVYDGSGGLAPQKILSMTSVRARTKVYNLHTDFPNTFFANYTAVHNKGGGCFLPGTLILKSDGTETAISAVKKGDELLSFADEGKAVKARVLDIITVEADEYFELKTDRITVRATAEHPFYTGGGTFRALDTLKAGDTVYAYAAGGLVPQKIISMTRAHKRTKVYNLHTDSPNTFFADYAAVHNKGGCFAAGTLIDTPNGKKAIERLSAGDTVYAYEGGRLSRAGIIKVFVASTRVLRVKAGGRVLDTTAEHPLLTRKGFAPAGTLKAGDEIALLDGTNTRWVKTEALETSREARPVYNLEVAPPHTFIAGGFIVHNKGGYHGRSGRSDPGFLIFMGIVVLIVKIKEHFSGEGGSGGDEPEVRIPQRDIAPKADRTRELLRTLAARDRSMDPEALKNAVTSVFTKLQMCWTSRDYTPIKGMLTPYIYASHSSKLEKMRNDNEINVVENVQVRAIDFVMVKYTQNPPEKMFTALITAAAKDYYIDDRDNSFLRGDSGAKEFQEFWTFHFRDGNWLLAAIEQTTESEALSRENICVQPAGPVTEALGFAAAASAALPAPGGAGTAAAAPARAPETASDGQELSFKPRTAACKGWSRTGAELAASLVFLNVYAAWEKGDAEALPKDDVLPEMRKTIGAMIKKYQADGLSFRFEDLAVSKAVPVLVNGPTAGSGEEFVARIYARARRTLLHDGTQVYQDPFSTPFTEYWVFEKQDKRWKLKELLPRADGRKVLSADDQETDSCPAQLEWYYPDRRAA